MNTERNQVTTIEKEMGITHKDFYAELPKLLNNSPYQQSGDTISFRHKGKDIEISLGPEGVRKVGPSVRLPVTGITLRLFGFSEKEIRGFIDHFNLKFMKGGG
ncbi:MAG: hypothetical protein EP304_06250 [Deltaproteobacteria bacterium]|nr:MAG: hypothetical protein EP304_06250 [Deltaproteobacteria bacterium]